MATWAKLGLGFRWTLYGVQSGPQLGQTQLAQLGLALDIVRLGGLNWAYHIFADQ